VRFCNAKANCRLVHLRSSVPCPFLIFVILMRVRITAASLSEWGFSDASNELSCDLVRVGDYGEHVFPRQQKTDVRETYSMVQTYG
jgi:hypothetical protein